MRRMRFWPDVPVGTALLLLTAALVYPVFAQVKTDQSPSCFHSLRMLAFASLEYVETHDDRYPLRDAWMDEVQGSVSWNGAFRCPQAPERAYGYAFNGFLSGLSEAKVDDPMATPMIYDSVDPIRNASDLVTSLPSPGRHHGEDLVAYAEGHVKPVRVP